LPFLQKEDTLSGKTKLFPHRFLNLPKRQFPLDMYLYDSSLYGSQTSARSVGAFRFRGLLGGAMGFAGIPWLSLKDCTSCG